MGNIDNNFPNADQSIPSPGRRPGLNSGPANRNAIPDSSSASGRAADDPMLTTTTLGPGAPGADVKPIRQVAVPDDSNKSGITAYHRSSDEARMFGAIPSGPGADLPSPGPVYPGQLGKGSVPVNGDGGAGRRRG